MITKTQQHLFNKLPDKIKDKITIDENGCWLCNCNMNRNGYARFYIDGGRKMAHITTYKILKSNYDENLLLDHLCKNRNCCNPAHLSPVTPRQNVHRGNALLFKPA